MMVHIAKEQLVVFLFLKMASHKRGQQMNGLFNFFIIKPGHKYLEQLFSAEKPEKEHQGTFIGCPVQAETDLIRRQG